MRNSVISFPAYEYFEISQVPNYIEFKKKKDKGDKPFEKLYKRYAIWNQSPAFFILQME